MLTSRERVTRALCLEERLDRIPFGEWEIQPRTLKEIIGRDPVLYNHRETVRLMASRKREKLVNNQIRDALDLAKKLGIDMFYLPLVPPENYEPPQQVSENRWILKGKFPFVTTTITYAPVQSTYVVCEYDPSSGTFWEVETNLNSVEAMEDYAKELESERDVSVDPTTLEVIERVVEEIGDEVFLVAAADGTSPFLGSQTWFPIWMKCQYTHPNLIRRILTEHTRRSVEVGKAAIDAGVHAILMPADFATKHGPFMSPRQFREFYLPEIKKHHDAYHKKGVFVIQHKDGNIMSIADDLLIGSGPDALQAIEPTADMSLAEMKMKYGDRICLMGNVDCVYTLVRNSVEDTIAETRQCIRTGAPGGGYVLSSSNVIVDQAKPENYLAMVDTGKKYGKYPLRT